ncbi:MAG: hypothetical protein J5854_01990 [Clostridia bacterium]|nr:hypothetical protein [Clostridia bacterium]
MDVFKIAGIAIITAILALTLKNYRPELSLETAVAGGIILTIYAVTEFTGIADAICGIAEKAGIDRGLLSTVLKAAGTAYVTQISSDLCRDAREQSLSSKVEICGRLIIASEILPVFIKVFGQIIDLLGEYL